LALALILYFTNQCQEPRTFSVGEVDSKFSVKNDDVVKMAKEAAERWNRQTDTTLLKYDKNSNLKIDLIYDERQMEIDKWDLETAKLEKNRQSVESVKDQFDRMLSQFQQDLAAYNQEVAYWNSRGGAQGSTFTRLEQTRVGLNNRREQLVSMSKTLNIQAENYNSNLQDLQNTLNSKKNIIITQGLYKPANNKIEIYTFGNTDELRLVLMHELGHAIGLDHGRDKDSIMYYLLGNQDLADPKLTGEDVNMTKSRCDARSFGLYQYIFRKTGSNVN
jgi:predicted Zn-dependent protease